MGIWSDIKKAAKGSKEYQKRKKGPISKAIKKVSKDVKSAVKGSKEYQAREKGPISKAVKQVSKDVKSAVKGSKEYQAGKAKKKAGKTWTKAVKAQKKTGGPTMNELIKQRNAAEKGSEAYAKAQNQINKAYGSKKRYEGGGRVESNPYGWPSSDSRGRK